MSRSRFPCTLKAYIGTSRIQDLSKKNMAHVEKSGSEQLLAMTRAFEERPALWETVFVANDFNADADLVLVRDGGLSVFSKSLSRFVAAETASFPFVDPDFRGKGVGSALTLARTNLGLSDRRASFYTVGGGLSRIAAHRRSVQDFVDRREPLSDDIMKDYIVEGGKVRLKEPFDIRIHNREVEAELRRKAWDRVTREEAENQVFKTFRYKERGGFPNNTNNFEYGKDDVELVLALHEEFGGTIVVDYVMEREKLGSAALLLGDVLISFRGASRNVRESDDPDVTRETFSTRAALEGREGQRYPFAAADPKSLQKILSVARVFVREELIQTEEPRF